MAENKYTLTYNSVKKYEEELHYLKVTGRREIANKIKEAREQGDISENAEYDAAMDEQRDMEARIEHLESILRNSEVIVEEEVNVETVSVGCKVKLFDIEYDEEVEFSIVGSIEANSLEGKISNESPIGIALLGKRVGDKVEVETQVGIIVYEILAIGLA